MTGPETGARRVCGLSLLFVLTVLTACSPGGEPASLTPIPAIDTRDLGNTARSAIEEAHQAALAAPETAATVGRYAMILHAYGQASAAEGAYLRAMALDPLDSRWAVYRGLIRLDSDDYEGAAAMFYTADPDASQPVVQVYLARAEAAVGDYAAAAARLDRLLLSHPDRIDALLERGRLATIADQPQVAAQRYRHALAVVPGLAEAHYGLAQALSALGQDQAAIDQLAAFEASRQREYVADDDPRRAVAASVVSERTLIDNGRRLLASGENEQARDEFERALAINPGNLSTLTNLIVVYGRLGDNERASATYREALAINPRYYNAHYNFGIVAAHAGQAQAAEKAFEQAAESDPSRPEPYIEYGRLLASNGQSRLAVEQYRRALDRDPDSTASRLLLGRQLALLGDYAAASMHLERLVASDDPAVPGIMRVLAGVYGQAGDVDRARTTLMAARERARSLGQEGLTARLDNDLERLAAASDVPDSN